MTRRPRMPFELPEPVGRLHPSPYPLPTKHDLPHGAAADPHKLMEMFKGLTTRISRERLEAWQAYMLDPVNGAIARLDRGGQDHDIIREISGELSKVLFGTNIINDRFIFKFVPWEEMWTESHLGTTRWKDFGDGRGGFIEVRIAGNMSAFMEASDVHNKSLGQYTVEVIFHEFAHAIFHHSCCHGRCAKQCMRVYESQIGKGGHGLPWFYVAKAIEAMCRD